MFGLELRRSTGKPWGSMMTPSSGPILRCVSGLAWWRSPCPGSSSSSAPSWSAICARSKTYDYWLSTIAGLALIVVALVPTGRALNAPGFIVNGKSCLEFPGPPDCTGFQKAFDENNAKLVHGIAAAVFVLLLAALCFVFALREFGFGPAAGKLCGDPDVDSVRAALKAHNVRTWRYLWWGTPEEKGDAPPPKRRVPLYLAMGLLILLAGAWAKFGADCPSRSPSTNSARRTSARSLPLVPSAWRGWSLART